MARVTAKQIAEVLGISTTSVSLALNNKPGVSEYTKMEIFRTAEELGYPLHRLANVPKPRNKTVAYVVFIGSVICVAEHSPFSTLVLQGLETLAATRGYDVVVRYFNLADMQVEDVMQALENMDGAVILGTDISLEQKDAISSILDQLGDMSVVMLDNPIFGNRVNNICNDNYGGTYNAVEHLLNTGHKNIGYLMGNVRITPFKEREAGVKQALAAHQMTPYMQKAVGLSYSEAYRDILDWLMTSPSLPDAIFADNDIIGAAAIRALMDMNIPVPEKVSIIGFDDVPIAQVAHPPLSSVKSFISNFGSLAFDVVANQVHAMDHELMRPPNLSIRISTQLVIRNSVKE